MAPNTKVVMVSLYLARSAFWLILTVGNLVAFKQLRVGDLVTKWKKGGFHLNICYKQLGIKGRSKERMGCVILSYYCYRGRIISVGRAFDCRAGGRGFDSRDRTNTQGVKITEKWRYFLCLANGWTLAWLGWPRKMAVPSSSRRRKNSVPN